MNLKKILLVDDEITILKTFKKDFEYEGYFVDTASNGSEALKILEKETFDLLISDLLMPEMNGVELIENAKKINSEMGSIILTGYGDLDSAINALRLGADDYLLKPCSIDELLLRVEKCFEKIEALKKVKLYEQIIPMCMYCQKMRDDTGVEHGKGEWMKPADYIHTKSSSEISHGICPDCYNTEIGNIRSK